MHLLASIALSLTLATSSGGQDLCDGIVDSITHGNLSPAEVFTREQLDCSSDSRSRTPLVAAAEIGSVPILQKLLDRGVDINRRSHHFTALLFAVWNQHEEASRLLIERGADVNVVTSWGTALTLAIERGNLRLVEMLLAAGAEIPATYRSPLFAAIASKRLDILDALLLHRPALNFEVGGMTPLSRALGVGDEEIVLRLLRAGADPRVRRKGAPSPLWVATRLGWSRAASAMKAKGARDRDAASALLLAAVEANDLLRTKEALRLGARTEVHDRVRTRGAVPLGIAAANGSEAIVRELLKARASVHARDEEQRTPLIMAAEAGATAVATLLLGHGALLEAADYRGRTALIAAAEHGSLELVRLLLDQGALVDAVSEGGAISDVGVGGVGTALAASLANHHNAVAALLLDRGADPEIEWLGPSSMSAASGAGNAEGLRLLLEKHPALRNSTAAESAMAMAIYSKNAGARTALQQAGAVAIPSTALSALARSMELAAAIGRRDGEAIRRLAAPDVINLPGDFGTPLCMAAQIGDLEMLELFLERGADINLDSPASSPMICALASPTGDLARDLAVIRFFLDHGARLVTARGTHVIEFAMNREVMQLLLDRGAELTREGLERLFQKQVQYWGQTEVLGFLLDHGADINAGHGEALVIASKSARVDTVRFLIDRGALVNPQRADTTPLLAAVRSDTQSTLHPSLTTTVELLLKAGANPDLPPVEYDSNLIAINHAAVHHEDVLELLVKAGANLERKDFYGNRPLHLAAQQQLAGNVKVLLEGGADINSLNTAGETPLILATRFGASEIVEILLRAGAGRSLRDKKGRRAIDWAKELRYDAIARRLAE